MNKYLSSVIALSKSKHGDIYLTENFQAKEFSCQDGSDQILIHPLIPIICQIVRNNFNMPFTPNSAYRTPSHNEKIKGAKNSNHIYGLAVDIPAMGKITPKQLYVYLDKMLGNWGELGLYEWGVHVGLQHEKVRF